MYSTSTVCSTGYLIVMCTNRFSYYVSDEMVRPVFLPCLHCVCRNCALTLLGATGQQAHHRLEVIACPEVLFMCTDICVVMCMY